MSFSGTPLGQGRRLDHQTFLNKNHRLLPQRDVPTSYAYGAPTSGTRSPPKPSSPVRDRTVGDSDEPALARYARLKQREQSSRSVAPGIINSPPHPEKWSVKDTSVNIATAFHQAASTAFDMPSNNPNNSWASGSRPATNVPRSTSVEYESQSQSTSSRRLPPPPNRLAVPHTTTGRKPISKNASIRHVPDSEEEEPEPVDQNGREKSPFEHVLDITKRALAPATFYLRQRSHEPEASTEQPAPTNGTDPSYDYSAEEREYQALQSQQLPTKRPIPTHKRGRMSTDNKAYRPSQSDLEASDEDFEDDGKKGRRRKKKKDPPGGPLTNLPIAAYSKKRKNKNRGSKGNLAGPDDEDESGSEEHISEQHSITQRRSIPPASAPPLSRASVSRESMPSEPQYNADDSMDVEPGLTSIPEIDEHQLDDQDQSSSSHSFSVGALLGKIVHWLFQIVTHIALFFLQGLSMIFFLFGRVLGTVFDIVLNRPAQWISHTNPGPVITLGKYLVVALTLYGAWYALHDPLLQFLPSRPLAYNPPDVPAANIVELSTRLQRIENVLAGLSQEHERSKFRQENELKGHGELIGRLGSLESRVQRETVRAVDAEVQFRTSTSQGLEAVRQEVEVLHAQLQARSRQQNGEGSGSGNDEEARAKLKALEERVGSVEGGVKEALDLGKNSLKAGGAATSAGAAWWNKLASGSPSKSGLTIKSADGQDVTSLIGYLVDSAVSQYGKDVLARPDFALHSGGAQIIPSLTSPTFEISPPNIRGQIVSFVTGHGYAIGRPPITALHHELHNGHCWPFAGSEGQLGVALAAPTYISDVTIDHVAKEVAFDMHSAPKEMEVWALVEGKDNTAKVKEWQAEKARRREEARVRAENEGTEIAEDDSVDVYPKTLPKSPPYIRIASFAYDINTPNNVQTFPVSQEIRDLGVDFGIVVLRIKSNWGRNEFTCLYRLRVHGERMESS